MFGKLKDKLKSTLSIFSKKAEEEAEVKEEIIEKEEITEESKEEIKEEKKEAPKKEKKKEKSADKKVKEEKEEKKPKVLIIHGWEDNSKSGFIPSLEKYLNKNNYEAKSFDQPNTEEPKFEEWFKFAEGKIEDSDKDNLSIVGHSMGGLLSLKLAEKHKLKKLILVAPVGSKPSEDYFRLMKEKLDSEELEIFRKYQDRTLDIKKIKSNVEEIAFVFGLKDPWITEEIRDSYVKSFKDVAEIHIFDKYAHMSESEGVKELTILEELFSRKLKPGIVEHKEEKVEKKTKESKKVEEEKETPKEEPEKKSFFKKIFSKKEEVIEEKVEEEKTEEPEEKEKKETEVQDTKEEKVEEPKVEKEEPKKSFLGKVKQSFTTKTISADKFEELFWDLELVLLENNVSVEVVEKIKEDLKLELVDKPLPRDVPKKIEETLKETLTEILSYEKTDILKKVKDKQGPFVIAMFGINGTGKTTSIAKLANYFQKNKLSVVLAACDTFRAAAIQQLEEHANRLGVKIIKHDYGSDAAAVAFDAIRYAEKNKVDVVMIDTAGRLHSNTNLMGELRKIIKVTSPDMKIFVGESITGNDCIEQARKFNDLVEMDGAILTKADVDDKGGAPLSISYTIKKPIFFLGVGQKYEDLEEFNPEVILKRLGF